MVRPDYFDDYRNLPDYYDTMYQDGFSPQQIFAAFQNKTSNEYMERKQLPTSIHITTERKIKK